MSDTPTYLRKWTKSPKSTQFVFYDLGETQWFLQEDGSIKTYKILSRKVETKEDSLTVVEEVLLLPEMPVPLEAHQQQVRGWQISDFSQQVMKEGPLLPLPVPAASSPLPSQTNQGNKKQQPALLQQPSVHQSSSNQTHRAKRSPAGSESGEEQLSQQTVTLPTELWLSLSQWIPPNALFQPSLHHQAILELQEQPNQISVVRSTQGTYSQPQRGRPQYGARGMPPRHGLLQTGVFSHKPRVHQQDFFAKPLFI